jgi:hypothetical protein
MSGKPGHSGGRRKGAGRKLNKALGYKQSRVAREYYLSPESVKILDALPPGTKSQFVDRAIQMHARYGRHFPA